MTQIIANFLNNGTISNNTIKNSKKNANANEHFF